MADSNFEVDVKEFCFKQLCQLQVFDAPQALITDTVNLLVVSNKYAKIYVAAGTEIKQVDVATIEKLTATPGLDLKSVVSTYDHKSINTRKSIKHIALSCDDLTLSVVFEENGALWVGCLDVRYIGDQSLNECFFAKGQLTTELGVTTRELKWHPEDPDSALICLSNGSVSQIKIVNQSVHIIFTLPQGLKCFSVDWSTRGKNFAAGQEDGRLMLYDRKMVLKKELPCPEEFNGTKHKVAKVKWISSHNFAAVYLNAESEEPPKFFCIVTQKDGPTIYTNMEDIYFGYNEDRQLCFYIETLPEWNLLTTMASNAFEGVPICKLDNKWTRWNLDDSSRVVMPFVNDNDETFPCGIAINLNSTLIIAEGESKYPPAPLFMMISTHGILCTYQMMNKFQGVNHNILVKATAMSLDGVRKPMQTSQLSSSRQHLQVKPVETKAAVVGSSLPKPFSGAAFDGLTGADPVKSAAKEQAPSQTSAISSKQPLFSTVTTTSSGLFGGSSSGFSFGGGSSNLFTTPTKTDTTSSSGKLPSLFQQVPTQATNLPSSNKESLAMTKITAQQIPPEESSTASMKPLSFDSKPNLFASSTAATKPLFDFGSKVAPLSQQNVTSSVQEISKPAPAFGFVSPRPTAQLPTMAQASNVTFSGFTQPETGSKQQSVSAPSVTAFGANVPSHVAKPESAVKPQAQQQMPAGRVPPGSRLLQMGTASQVTETKPMPQQTIAAVEELPPVRAVQVRKETPQLSMPEEASKIDKMSKDLGYAINKSIMEEMTSFSKELSAFKVEMNSCEQMVNGIGTRDEMMSLKRDTDLVSKMISDFQGCHKEHQSECSQLKNQMMKSFDNLEQARVQETSISDRRYNSLLKSRALDPVTSRQRKELRSQLNYLTALISDVNDSLDIAWEQAQMNGSRRGKSLKTNGMHNIYVAMESIDKIINNLANQIDAISLNAEKTDVVSQSVMHRGGSSSTHIQEEEKGSAKIPQSSVSIKSPGMSPLKQSQFQAFLTKTGGSPVKKSSHRESFSAVKPRAASTPATSSTARNVFAYQPETPATDNKLETLKESKMESTLKSFPKFVPKAVKREKSPESLATSFAATEQGRTVKLFQSKPMSFPEEKPSIKLIGMASAFGTSVSTDLYPAVPSVSETSKPQHLISGFMKPLIPAGEQPKSSPVGFLGSRPLSASQAVSAVESFATGKPISPIQFAKTAPPKTSVTSGGAVIPAIPTSRPKSEAVAQLGLSGLGSSSFKLGTGSKTVLGSAEPTQSNVGAFGAPRQSPGLFGPISTANTGLSISDSGSAFTSNAKANSNPDLFGTAAKPLFGAATSAVPLWSAKSTELTGQFASISKSSSMASSSMPVTAATAPKQIPTTSTSFGIGDKGKAIFNAPEGPTKSVAVAFNPSSLWAAAPPLRTSSTLAEASKSDDKAFAMPPASSGTRQKLLSAVPASLSTSADVQGTSMSPHLTSAQSSPGKDEARNTDDVASIATTSGSVPSATGGIFGSSKSGALFSTKPSQPSTLFGSQAQAGSLQGISSTTSGTSLFGSQIKLTTTVPAIGNDAKVTSSSLFGTSTESAKAPLFGIQSLVSSQTPSSSTKATTTTTSLFGTSVATTSVGLFGTLSSASSQPTPSGDQAKGSIGLFTTTTSANDKPSLFGSKTNVSSSSAFTATDSADQTKGLFGSSLFGSATTSSDKPTLFGSKSDVSAGSAFTATKAVGNTAVVTQPSQGLFGSSSFGAAATASDKPSLFGSKSNIAAASAFTSTNTPESKPLVTQQSQGLFGSKPAEPPSKTTGLFGSGSTFGGTSTGGGLFSSQSTSAPGGLFQTTTTSQTAFGSTGQPAFGQTSSGFGSQQPSSTSGVGFGGFGLGGKPTNDPSKNPFGSVPAASSSSGSATGLFGSTSTGGIFGSTPQTTSPEGKGAFSKGFGSGFASGGAAATTSGFGASATGAPAFGGGTAFGGGATFGSSGASFGGAPAFGGTAAFGGAPAFGSTSPAGPAFGSGTPGSTPFGSSNSGFGQTASFGALGQQSSPSFGGLNSQAGNATFGNLASDQNAPGFGNLAGQSSFGQSGASFGQTPSPQGSSFASWR